MAVMMVAILRRPLPEGHRADPLENFSRHRRRYDRRDCGTRRHDRRTRPHRPVAAAAVIHLGLTPALATAYRFFAKAQAQREGVPLWITSGKRSWAEQESMWRDGIATYGSQPPRIVGSAASRVDSRHRSRDRRRPSEGAQWLARKGDPLGPVPHVPPTSGGTSGRDRAGTPCPPKYVDSAHR